MFEKKNKFIIFKFERAQCIYDFEETLATASALRHAEISMNGHSAC